MTHIDYLILQSEHELGGSKETLPYGLLYEMRLSMPYVADHLSQAISHSNRLEGQNTLQKVIRENFVPFILENFEGKSETSDTRVLAVVLDLGVLSSVFPAARIALAELVNCGVNSCKTAALLSLLYCGFNHDQLDEIDLYGMIESRRLFEIPLQMFQVMMPKLEKVFQRNAKSLNLLHDWFSNPMKTHLFPSDYHRAEVAILLANLGKFSPMILQECLLEWADWLETDNPYYHTCRTRCLKAVARLIGTNQEALDHYKKEIANRSWDGRDLNDWTNPLFYLTPNYIDIELFHPLLQIADVLLKASKREDCMKAVQAFAKLSSTYHRFSSEIRAWILSRLESSDEQIVLYTLKGITELSPVDQNIARQVLELKTNPETRIAKTAADLATRWQP